MKSNTNPLVSIIIATFNRAHLILETLNSIKNQTYVNFECIIIDDGSSDDTEIIVNEFIKKDNRFRFYKRPIYLEKGHCSSRNYGFDLSKGEYINWFDDDDIMHLQCLEKRILKIQESNYDFVSCEIGTFTNDFNENTPIVNDYKENIFQNYYTGNISFYSVCALWKKSFLIEHKFKFIEEYKPLEDWFFNINALFITKKYFLLKEVLIYYRIHENTISDHLANYNVQLVYQEFITRRKMYLLYSKNRLLNLKVVEFYLNRLRFLLRAMLVMKDKRASVIFNEYLKISIRSNFFLLQKAKTCLGYFAYCFFGKGYSFLTSKNK